MRLLAATLCLTLAFAGSAAAAPTEPITHAGRFLTDAQGRVVVIHGTTEVVKAPIDQDEILPADDGFGPDDAKFLADNGFNAVRVGLWYRFVEPHPGQFDSSYVERIAATQRELADAGVLSLLDMHQDQFTKRYAGRGFPDWMAIDDGLPNTGVAYPNGYYSNPAMNRAYDNFFANVPGPDGVGLEDHFAAGWQRVARRFAQAPGVLGYDVFNEPWPGTQWPSCASTTGCPPGGFDQTSLTAMSSKVIGAIRGVDTAHLAFYEPNLQYDFGASTGHGKVNDPNVGFTFHSYCLAFATGIGGADPAGGCGVGEQLNADDAKAHSAATGAALLNGEFGPPNDIPRVERVSQIMDQNLISWIHWHYWDIIKDTKRPAGGDNVQEDRLKALSYPYPPVIAGTPTGYGFDRSSRRFTLDYSTERAGGGGRFGRGSTTEVFVAPIQYPDGYGVQVAGAEVASGLGSSRLEIRTCSGASNVSLGVTPGRRAEPASCAEQAAAAGGASRLELPSSRSCLKNGRLAFYVRLLRKARLVSVSVRARGKRIKVRVGRPKRSKHGQRRVRVVADLSRFKPGARVKVRVGVKIRQRGRTRTHRATRTYRICR